MHREEVACVHREEVGVRAQHATAAALRRS